MDQRELSNYRALSREVRHLRALLCDLERDPDGYVAAVALYRDRVSQKEAALLSIERAIDSLGAPAERMILRLRYLEGRSWVSVCMALQPLGYGERQVYRLHGSALARLRDIT